MRGVNRRPEELLQHYCHRACNRAGHGLLGVRVDVGESKEGWWRLPSVFQVETEEKALATAECKLLPR